MGLGVIFISLCWGIVFNAIDGAEKLGLNATELEQRWAVAKKNKDMIKFGGGFYCAKIDDYYLFNGFFMSMRGTRNVFQVLYL